jgi:hypothetical protein
MTAHRRGLLAGALALSVFGCQTPPGGTAPTVTLDMAKAWAGDLAGALVAAASAYSGPNADQARTAAGKLQQAAADFAAMGDVSTTRSAAISVLTLCQQVAALVPLPGDLAIYIPMGIAVLQAFVADLPPPPDAPAQPPAALHRAAMRGR